VGAFAGDSAAGDYAGDGVFPVCVAPGTMSLAPEAGEKYLSITIADKTGRPVEGALFLQSGTGNAKYMWFCGSVHNYLVQSSDLNSLTVPLAADASCPSVPTTGTVTATFSNLP
jgi:hypothetical protein